MNDQIAARLDTRREVVSIWRKRFFEERLAGLDERSRPGRPRVFPPELVVQVNLRPWLASYQPLMAFPSPTGTRLTLPIRSAMPVWLPPSQEAPIGGGSMRTPLVPPQLDLSPRPRLRRAATYGIVQGALRWPTWSTQSAFLVVVSVSLPGTLAPKFATGNTLGKFSSGMRVSRSSCADDRNSLTSSSEAASSTHFRISGAFQTEYLWARWWYS